MIPLDITTVMAAAQVDWHRFGQSGVMSGELLDSVSTDTRTIETGSVFVGLSGPNYDGARFAHIAAEKGAAAIIVGTRCTDEVRATLTALSLRHGVAVGIARDGRRALAGIARAARARLSADVIGITGSCGKTSTKAVLRQILASGGEPEGSVVVSQASFNNDVGVPLTLLTAGEQTRSLVVEIGTNAPGEVAPLAKLAAPHVAIVTNVGRSHLEGLGSVEGVAREKRELFANVVTTGGARGACVLNLDCSQTPLLRAAIPAGARVLTTSAGGDRTATLFASGIRHDAGGTTFVLRGTDAGQLQGAKLAIPLLGKHAVQNVLSGIAAMVALGRSLGGVRVALGQLSAEPRRLDVQRIEALTVIDDTYNANPESVRAAIDVLERQPVEDAGGARRVLVLGAMGELGSDAVELHREVGQRIAASSIDLVLVVGAGAASAELDALAAAAADATKVLRATSVDEALDAAVDPAQLCLSADRPDVVLVKASRASALDRLVDGLRGQLLPETSGAADSRDTRADRGKGANA